MLFDNDGKILTPKEIMELSKTEEGRKQVGNYIIQARVAYGVQAIFESLGVVPIEETQQMCCQAMYDCLTRVPIDYVMEWCQAVAEGTEEEEEFVGNC